jgi:hypothetical protein
MQDAEVSRNPTSATDGGWMKKEMIKIEESASTGTDRL